MSACGIRPHVNNTGKKRMKTGRDEGRREGGGEGAWEEVRERGRR